MKIEKINLFEKGNPKEDEVIEFDEWLGPDGCWSPITLNSSSYEKVVEIVMVDMRHRYYLAANDSRDIMLFRCKK